MNAEPFAYGGEHRRAVRPLETDAPCGSSDIDFTAARPVAANQRRESIEDVRGESVGHRHPTLTAFPSERYGEIHHLPVGHSLALAGIGFHHPAVRRSCNPPGRMGMPQFDRSRD